MANFIIEDLKREWNKPENGLIKIILIIALNLETTEPKLIMINKI